MADATSLYITTLGNLIINKCNGKIQACADDGSSYLSKCQACCSYCTDCFLPSTFNIAVSVTPDFSCRIADPRYPGEILITLDIDSAFVIENTGSVGECTWVKYQIGNIVWHRARYANTCNGITYTVDEDIHARIQVFSNRLFIQIFSDSYSLFEKYIYYTFPRKCSNIIIGDHSLTPVELVGNSTITLTIS